MEKKKLTSLVAVEENQSYASTVVLSKTGRMSIAVHHAGKKHLVKFARSTSNNDIIKVMNRMCGVTKENQDRVIISVVQPGRSIFLMN